MTDNITVEPTTETDFVYGLGILAVVAQLELSTGILVACLPTLAPFYSKCVASIVPKLRQQSRKHSSQKHLKKACHTIGSARRAGFRKRAFNRSDENTSLELEEGGVSGTSVALVSSSVGVNDNLDD